MNSPPQAHILVVDDIEANRDLLGRYLTQVGYQVETATGGTEALQIVSNQTFELILLDIMMPDIDGFMVLESLRK